MNRLDKDYQQLLQNIIEFGVDKNDRTGTGTRSLFGCTIRHNMKNGFPLLTTKKMAWKTMVTELLWFLRGDTNIKYLVDNGCNIWNGDAYKRFLNETIKVEPLEVKQRAIEQLLNSKESKEEFINKIKTDDEFAKKWGELGPIYGKQWRKWTKKKMWLSTDGSYENIYDEADQTVIDQILCLINNLKTNPDSRRLMVNAWNVGELDEMVLPPCHYGFQVYTRELSNKERIENYNSKFENKIEVPFIKLNLGDAIENTIDIALSQVNIPTRAISLMWNQRSVDVFLGLPFNIASYGLLLEMIAREVNMVPEHLIGHLGDTHLYSNHIEQAKQQIDREPFELPKLNINTEFWQTESGECGVGPLKTNLQGFEIDDFQLENYQSHPSIKAPLSN